jgi:hypothetical protein
MSFRSLEASFFVEQAPDIEFRDGLFHVTHYIGNYRFERVMLPSVLIHTIEAGQEALRQYREHGSAQVIPVDFDAKFERVFGKKDAVGDH